MQAILEDADSNLYTVVVTYTSAHHLQDTVVLENASLFFIIPSDIINKPFLEVLPTRYLGTINPATLRNYKI